MQNHKVISLILNAGESSRMGKPKALLPWNGKTFLHHTVKAARDAGVTEVIVVLGAHADEIRDEVSRLRISHTLNSHWQLGMGSSIKAGLSLIQSQHPDADAVLIQLSDQPRITAESIAQLLTASSEHPDRIIAADYDGLPGAPALFPKRFFPFLFEMPDEAGAKKVLLHHQEHLVRIAIPGAAQDVDTPQQYEQLKKQ